MDDENKPYRNIRVKFSLGLVSAAVVLTWTGNLVRADDDDSHPKVRIIRASPELVQTVAGNTEEADTGMSSRSDPGDIDSLLDLAEKDASQLSQMRVRPTGTAPAMETIVTTVSRTPSTVGKSPAAVFVITNDMIRRSGAQSIPEVLRMAPGIHVARIDGNKWAVSARGFNDRFANKLLVQVDGRTAYTPLYAGTYWDIQDVVLEDVERIEVIRGPGASVWGANAVNGVINIITKKAKDTQGTYLQAGGGSFEKTFTTARHGGAISDTAHYRAFGKWFERDAGNAPDFLQNDDSHLGHGGFRTDWNPGGSTEDLLTFQGDYYRGDSSGTQVLPSVIPPAFRTVSRNSGVIEGGNLLGRWVHTIDEDTEWSIQGYYDRTDRTLGPLFGFSELRDTFDIDAQFRFLPAERHKVVVGMGYRLTHDRLGGLPQTTIWNPNTRDIDMLSGFIQDEIALIEDFVSFTIGTKLLTNTYTDFEYQPTARLLLTPSERVSIWGAVSRAVRTPSRSERDIRIVTSPMQVAPVPVYPVLFGNSGLQSEELMAYELGMRSQMTETFSWDAAFYANSYRDLVALSYGPFVPGVPFGLPGLVLPVVAINGADAETYGGELGVNFDISESWKLRAAYSLLMMSVHSLPGANELGKVDGSSPAHQFYAQSSWDFARNWELDLIVRHASPLHAQRVDNYWANDVRLAWKVTEHVETFVVGRGIFNDSHPEFGFDTIAGGLTTEVQSEVFGGVNVRF